MRFALLISVALNVALALLLVTGDARSTRYSDGRQFAAFCIQLDP